MQGKIANNMACIINIQKFSIHDGPGIRTTVFFKGCPLRCKWCSNPESQSTGVQPEREESLSGKLYTMEEVLAICREDKDFYLESGGGVTLSGGEVLMQADFATELLRKLQSEGVHTALETAGFAPREIFSDVCSCANLLIYDMKHYNNLKYLEGAGVGNRLILENLRSAVSHELDVLLRIPVIPGYNDSFEDALGFAELIKEIGLQRVQLLPFHQFGQKKYEALGIPYELDHLKTLHPEDLEVFQKAMLGAGVACSF